MGNITYQIIFATPALALLSGGNKMDKGLIVFMLMAAHQVIAKCFKSRKSDILALPLPTVSWYVNFAAIAICHSSKY